MNNFFRNFSLIFAAGAFGGLVKAMVAWGFGAAGLNALMGSKMAMGLTPMWIYAHVVWGGVWAFLFFLPRRGSLLRERRVIQPGPDADPAGDHLPENGEGHVGPGIGLYDAGSGYLLRGDLGSGHGVLAEIFPGGFRKPRRGFPV